MDRPPFQDPNAAGGQPGGAAHFSQQHGRTGRMHQPTPSGSFPSHPAPGQQPSQASTPSPLLHGPPQLPPQLFTTAAQLLDLTDKKLVLILRDGRKLIGVLRSWDQFANLVIQETVERVYAGQLYCDIPRGVFLVRGENVLLLGEVDLDKEDDIPAPYHLAPAEEVLRLKDEEDAQRKANDKLRGNKLQTLGFEAEHSGEILF